MKTCHLPVFFLLLGSLLFSACASPSAGQTPPTAAPTTQSSDTNQVVIRIAAGAIGLEKSLTQEGAQRYMDAHPDVRVEVIDVPELTDERLKFYQPYFESQSPDIDIYQIDVIWPGDLAQHFVDLYKYGAADFAADHFPAIIQNNTVNGKLVAMPWYTDAGLLYYRTDLFAKYEYNHPPATWDELEEMAQRIQEGERAAGNEDFWGFVWQGYAYEGLTCNALEWIVSNGGGTIISPDKRITINNLPAMQAIDRAASWVGTISPPGVTGFTEEDTRHVFEEGKALFMRNWTYAFPLMNEVGSEMRGHFKAAPLPAGEGGTPPAILGGWQLAVSRYSLHPDIAADVVFYLTGHDEQKIRAIQGGFPPTITALYQDPEALHAVPYLSTLGDVFANASLRPATTTAPHYSEISPLFYNAVFETLTGKTRAANALVSLEQELKKLLHYRTGKP
ncbi:MAG: ABC transporter substrate-binding protein [Anaerolineales bacterium]